MSQATIAIADVQGSADPRRLPINKVGIKDIRHPLRIRMRDGEVQHSVATFNMYVNLPHDVRGTHMSRFVEILNNHDLALSAMNLRGLLAQIRTLLGADLAHVEVRFPYFITKRAPVSGVPSRLDYDVTLIGECTASRTRTAIKVVVPVTSLCPCSKQISDYGAHNQRSHVTVSARLRDQELWIEDLIDTVEQEASCEIYGLIKRPDEKYITERAYDNPKFVEDMVRDVAARLNVDERIAAYVVESENFESIHNHSAYALIEHEKTPA